METQLIIDWIQTAIFIFAPALTLYIYRKKQITSLKNAANLIALQIKDIENNINYIKLECITQDFIINEQQMLNSQIVFEQNFWNMYRHELFNYLTMNEYELISKFYENVSMIKGFQHDIKNFILYSMQNKMINRYQAIFSSISNLGNEDEIRKMVKEVKLKYDSLQINAYVPLHYGISIVTYLSAYQMLSGTNAYSKLIKLSKKEF